MAPNDIQNGGIVHAQSAKPVVSKGRMRLDAVVFLFVQASGLGEDRIGNVEFSNVMKDCALHECVELIGIESGDFAKCLGIHRYPPGMRSRTHVLEFDGSSQGVGEFEVHDQRIAGRRLPRADLSAGA